jgi:hypothetical protein
MWSVHLVKSTFWAYKKHLQRWTDADGNPIISNTGWAAVLRRVEDRLTQMGAFCRPLHVNKFLSQCGARADHSTDNPGKTSTGVRGKEQSLLMLTLPFALPNLIQSEIALINEYYDENPGALAACLELRDREVQEANDLQDDKARAAARRSKRGKRRRMDKQSDTDNLNQNNNSRYAAWDDSDSDDYGEAPDTGRGEEEHDDDAPPETTYRGKHTYLCDQRRPTDPSEAIINLLYGYVEIVSAVRQNSTLDSELGPLFTKITRWDEECLSTMPFKSGQDRGWNFIKKHARNHAPDVIPWVGCTENVCASVSENCHQNYVKVMILLTNRHPDWTESIMMRMSMAELAVNILHLHAGEQDCAFYRTVWGSTD